MSVCKGTWSGTSVETRKGGGMGIEEGGVKPHRKSIET